MKKSTSKRACRSNAKQIAITTKYLQKVEAILGEPLIDIEAIAKEKEFYKTSNSKIIGIAFILASRRAIFSGITTLENIACQLAQILGLTVSKQSVSQKFYSRHIDFAKAVLARVFQQRLCQVTPQEMGILSAFNHVWVQDSTCIGLDNSIANNFPGKTHNGQLTANCRIQVILDMKNNQYSQMNVGSFRDNDQSATADILSMLNANDLVLRDAAYAKVEVFERITAASAYFVSKLSYNITIWNEAGTEKYDLLSKLKKTPFINEMVRISNKKLLVRLIVTKLSDITAERRRRTADKNKSGTTNHPKEYYELLGYAITVTNIPESMCASEAIFTLYRLRWRIEIIFKSWKSGGLCLPELLNNEKLSYGRVLMLIYCFLILIVALVMPIYNYCLKLTTNDGSQPNISILKLTQWLKTNHQSIDLTLPIEPQIDNIIHLIVAYCCYDKRKKNLNFFQTLY